MVYGVGDSQTGDGSSVRPLASKHLLSSIVIGLMGEGNNTLSLSDSGVREKGD